MQAYLNSAELKSTTVAAMRDDIDHERLVKGHYWKEGSGNGCFVGCVVRGSEHSKFEAKLGIPRILARLADNIFEGLPYDAAKQFTIDYLMAINVGSDLSTVWDKFALFLLVDAAHGVIKFAKTELTKKSIQDVADAYARKIAGDVVSVTEWSELRARAWSARNAADAADAAYAAYAAYAAAAYAADAAAAYAAAYAAAAYAADAARSSHYVSMAKALITFLREAV